MMELNRSYEFLDTLFLRAPLYSLDDYDLTGLAGILAEPSFRNALWLASPGFYRSLEKKRFDWNLLQKKERFTLCKYYNRMSFRPTPFGAFASFTLLHWSAGKGIRLMEDGAVLHVLPSREWQTELERVRKAKSPDLLLRTNPTLTRMGEQFRYVRSFWDPLGKVTFRVNALPAEEINACLTLWAMRKPVSRSALAERLVEVASCSGTEAVDYLDFLIGEQVLLTEWDGCLIEREDDGRWRRAADTAMASVSLWDNYWREQRNISFSKDLSLANRYRPLEVMSREWGIKPPGNGVYAGLERPVADGGIDPEWQAELSAAGALLQRIVIPYHTPALKKFKEAFRLKFESRKIPLLTALDPDSGISYGDLHTGAHDQGLLDGIAFPRSSAGPKELDWTAVHRMFLRIWLRNGQRSHVDPVMIREADVAELENVHGDFQLPPTLTMMFSPVGDNIVLDSVGGCTALSLMGRFSVFAPEVHALCRELADAESGTNPEVLFAEIHQLSDMHADNINRRMPLYGHIIHINTFPAETGQVPLALDDLLLSVRDEELILESSSLGKRIIPRLPTAYNFYHNGLAIFQLLGDLQFQGLQANLNFDPEKLFPGLDFYPRIQYRKTILSLAKWELSEKERQFLLKEPLSLGRLHLFRQERGIPHQVSMGSGDQQLVFDLADDAGALFFLEFLKEQKRMVLREYLEAGRPVTMGKKALAGQLIVLLKRKGLVYHGLAPALSVQGPELCRQFLPGSEWLYLKIYCTPEMADTLLLKAIGPVLRANGALVDCWFFIRYDDPEPHLRLRIKTREAGVGKLLRAFEQKLSQKQYRGFVRELQADTYQREIERYSPELMEAVEDCFFAGSEWVMADLAAKEHRKPAGTGEPLTFFLIYRMARTFLPGISGLSSFFSWRAAAFIREFGESRELRVDMDKKYRFFSQELRKMLENKPAREASDAAGDRGWQDLLDKLSGLSEAAGRWPEERRYLLLADLIHMQVNRMFSNRQRQHEALVCYFLYKYTISQQAEYAGT